MDHKPKPPKKSDAVPPWEAPPSPNLKCSSCKFFSPKMGDIGVCAAITERSKSVYNTGPAIMVMSDSLACWSHMTKAG